MRQLREYQSVLSDALHPEPKVGDQSASRPQAEVETPQGAKHADYGIRHARVEVLPPWNCPK